MKEYEFFHLFIQMRGQFALRAEVLRRTQDAVSEEVLPDVIDRDACRERFALVYDPSGEIEPVRPFIPGSDFRHGRWRARLHCIAFCEEVSPYMYV